MRTEAEHARKAVARWKDRGPPSCRDIEAAEAEADLRRAEAQALQYRVECLKDLSEEDFEPEVCSCGCIAKYMDCMQP